MVVTGWDIGGVNTKAARVEGGRVRAAGVRPYELQRDPQRLPDVLTALAREIGVASGPHLRCAVTMTAELSQMFRTKREGVSFVLDAVDTAFHGSTVRVVDMGGRLVTPEVARSAPIHVAAANWAATARVVARQHRDALLVDVGTTTTDIIPIIGGRVCAAGRTDPERLATGELVYTGVVRTPAEALASAVPLAGRLAGVSAEGFALAGDVHVWRGDLDAADYTWPTPDGRPATRPFAAERLARVVCGDLELLDEAAIDAIADALADAQRSRIAAAMRRVLSRHPEVRFAVVTGVGAFLAAHTAGTVGLAVVPLGSGLALDVAQCAPAACAALIYEQRDDSEDLDEHVDGENPGRGGAQCADSCSRAEQRVRPQIRRLVVKMGGGMLAHPAHFEEALHAIARAARERPLVIVPGGGPFADAVRTADARLGLSNDAAHWMAVLAMDQYAHLLASRLPEAVVVRDKESIERAVGSGEVPVLAPYGWLRETDPLPHSWDVTSDSIAGWVAQQVGAADLVLIKPPGADGAAIVDEYFPKVLTRGITPTIISADCVASGLDALLRV